MALNPFNDNIKIAAPKALDDNRGVFENGAWRPYNSKAEVLENIPLAYRYIGLQVDILIDGVVNTYWFQDGIETENDLYFKGLQLGETDETAYRGDRGKIAYDHTLLTNNPHNVTKEQVGLGNVDNTSDIDKPISAATQSEINGVSSSLNTHVFDTNNPHLVTKAQVGLSNVDNTPDADKPISTATQLAITAEATRATTAESNLQSNIIIEANRALAAEATLQTNINSKANNSDVNAPINIVFADLVSNTYTNVSMASKTAAIFYQNPTTLVRAVITFNSSGVVTMPVTAVSGFTATIVGTTASGTYAQLTDFNTLTQRFETHTKLGYFSDGIFSWDDTTKVLSWSSNIRVYNRKKLVTSPSALIISAGSIDFIAATSATTDQFWTVYVEAPTTFSDGGSVGNTNFTTADLKFKGHRDTNIGDIRKPTTIILFTYNKFNQTVNSPFFDEFIISKYLKEIGSKVEAPFVVPFNRYPNINRTLKKSFSKYMGISRKTAEDRFRVVTWGDSIFARDVHTGVLNIIPNSNPPSLTTKNIPAYIWEGINGNKPLYSRYDKAGIFTETGTFNTLDVGVSIWDNSGDIPCQTRVCIDTNAAVSFSIGTTVTYFNFIDRSDSIGTLDAIVSISGGNGIVKVKLDDGVSTWQEANGFIFSQRKIDSGVYDTNTTYQRRILFKKVSSGIGAAQSITISKNTPNSSPLMYWGIEEIPNTHGYVQLINVARGSHSLNDLDNFILGDILERKPDLVVFELPLINIVARPETQDPISVVNNLQDFLFGDRPGFENTWNLKSLSNGFVDFQVLLIIPHQSKTAYVPNSIPLWAVNAQGYDRGELYRAVKSYLYERDELPFIDMSTVFMDTILNDPLYGYDLFYQGYGSDASVLKNGKTYVTDGTHPNNKGVKVYANEILSLFNANTL